ncbi:MAG: hypothetical protein GX587_13565 [Bacteroidales bacterium]|nr:hypothetical protein [Bacteroidales bacterium]
MVPQKKYPFINVHTHQEDDPGVVSVLNIMADNGVLNESPKNVFFSAGFHPWYINPLSCPSENEVVGFLDHCYKQQGFLAVGEAGLDKLSAVSMEIQKRVFLYQAQWAERNQFPMIIHCVKSYVDLLLIRKENAFNSPWVFHAFNGNIQLAQELIRHGCYLSVGHFLFRPQTKVYKAFEMIPGTALFLETDESNLSIQQITNRAAELKNTPTTDLLAQLNQNFKTVFKRNPVIHEP